MNTWKVNGNNFIRTDNQDEAEWSENGNLYRRATVEEVLPGYDEFMAQTD